jgi:hypothetical protein
VIKNYYPDRGKKMFVHRSGISYTLYLQNNYYAQQTLKNREEIDKSGGNWAQSGDMDKGLDDYLSKIIDAIPELKEAEKKGIGIGVVILPESSSDALKQSVSAATDQMIADGTDPDILKDVLGIVKDTFSCDIENNNGYALIKNLTSTADSNDLNNMLENFKNAYGTDKTLSEALSKFADYLNEIWEHLNKQAGNNDAGSIFTSEGKLSPEEKKGRFFNASV